MSCCAPGVETAAELDKSESAGPSAEELLLSSRAVGEGLRQTDLSVPGVHCGACIHAIETALSKLDGVESARVNLSARRVSVRWREDAMPPIVETLNRTGYAAHLFEELAEGKDLAWWHPLVSGDPETVHRAGRSVQGRVVPEEQAGDLWDHVVKWPE